MIRHPVGVINPDQRPSHDQARSPSCSSIPRAACWWRVTSRIPEYAAWRSGRRASGGGEWSPRTGWLARVGPTSSAPLSAGPTTSSRTTWRSSSSPAPPSRTGRRRDSVRLYTISTRRCRGPRTDGELAAPARARARRPLEVGIDTGRQASPPTWFRSWRSRKPGPRFVTTLTGQTLR